jgi:ferredoxin
MGDEVCERLVIMLDGRRSELPHEPGEVILKSAWRARLRPPVSCCQGECGTCIAKVIQGSVAMHHNGVLSQGEVDQGYVLTCQGVPTAREVEVTYEG